MYNNIIYNIDNSSILFTNVKYLVLVLWVKVYCCSDVVHVSVDEEGGQVVQGTSFHWVIRVHFGFQLDSIGLLLTSAFSRLEEK